MQDLRIVLQLALEGPPKFHQHRLIAFVVDGLSVTTATFKKVGPVTLLLHVTPNCDLG